MNQKGISSIVIILIIVGVLVMAGGIWAWQSQKEKPVVCTQDTKLCPDGSYVPRTGPNCEFAACPEVKDETANWKTYTNTKYNYQLKVPLDFTNKAKPAGWVATSEDNSIDFSKEAQWYVVIQSLPDAPFYNPPAGTELISWLKQYNQSAQYPIPGTENIQSSNFLIGGIPAVKIYDEGRPQAFNAYRIYFIKDSHLFLIQTLAETNTEELCNQIISTFKFTQ